MRRDVFILVAALFLIWGLSASGIGAWQVTDEGGESAPEPASAAEMVIDLTRPAFEVFRNWPPDELHTQAYWLPWEREAFRRASLFGRPVVFVLTVNWGKPAQTLQARTLSHPDVMRAINANYISVSVNADLHPAVASRYGAGFWPTISLLLPTGYPVLSQAQDRDLSIVNPITTTVIPPSEMKYVFDQGAIYWSRWAELLVEVGRDWAELNRPAEPQGESIDLASSDYFTRSLLASADRMGGGFGLAPKFVIPWLDEYAAKLAARGQPELRVHSRLTLEQLVESPLYDNIDGGLHRMAAAPNFEQIQYEKMLEGNAAFVRDLTYALRGGDSPSLRRALAETVDFLIRILGREGGGFHLAQVADPTSRDGGGYWSSPPEGRGEAPPADRLVLSGANALAGAALMRAGLLLDDEEITRAARAALELVRDRGRTSGRGVRLAVEPGNNQRIYLIAQAEVALAFVDAFETTGDPAFLETAREIVDFALANLREPGETALRDYLAGPYPVGLMARPHWPRRANVRLARAMLRLTYLGRGEEYAEQARGIIEALSAGLFESGVAGLETALAIEEAFHEPLLVEIAGPVDDPQTRALRRAAVNAGWPWTLVSTAERSSRKPLATLTFRESERKVRRAEDLASMVDKLTVRPEEANR